MSTATRTPESADFEWDVFLSHCSQDKPRVARLARRLEASGFRVWFDRARIESGEDIVAAIEYGLEHSRVLILCMTKGAFESEWVRTERNTATFRDPSNLYRRFLPLRFEDCPIPAMLRRLKYIDWQAESDGAWHELLAALQPGAARLPELPPDRWNPFDPYMPALGGSFVGREYELRRMCQAMEMRHSMSVVGDWRIGKTSLLAGFAEQVRATGRVVRQLSGQGPEGRSISAFVTQVTGRPAPDEPDEAANQLSEWASANHRMGLYPVLIMDDVERLVCEFAHRFFERMRGMLERVMVVLCSRRDLDLIYEELGRPSPFHNTLELLRVALLTDKAVDALLRFGQDQLRTDDISAMREWAGPHPYFLQLFGHELIDALLNGETAQIARDRFSDAANMRFRELWRVLNEKDRTELLKSGSDIPTGRLQLRLRGLVNNSGLPFGRVFKAWLNEVKS